MKTRSGQPHAGLEALVRSPAARGVIAAGMMVARDGAIDYMDLRTGHFGVAPVDGVEYANFVAKAESSVAALRKAIEDLPSDERAALRIWAIAGDRCTEKLAAQVPNCSVAEVSGRRCAKGTTSRSKAMAPSNWPTC